MCKHYNEDNPHKTFPKNLITSALQYQYKIALLLSCSKIIPK